MQTNEPDTYERRLLSALLFDAVKEQRARRRWGIFFKFLFFAYLVAVTLAFSGGAGKGYGGIGGGEKYAAVIPIEGVISSDGANAAAAVNAHLRAAFDNENIGGIILKINSPGGSAVESHRIYKEILRLREKYPDKKVYAVAGDFCASGGYFIASAAEEIYADESSFIGSIGVIFSGFGYVGAMEKLGVERRVITAGGSKNMLDPFLPQNAEDVEKLEDILADIHGVFISAVKEGRGAQLADAPPSLFSGRIYSGIDSERLGLIDGFMDVGGVARDLIGAEHVIYYTKSNWYDRFLNSLGASMARHLRAEGGGGGAQAR